MSRETRAYGHFCMLARALERLGDRWTLLIVRDLLVAPRRFTDLMDRLSGITPKTLSTRLKELDAQGVVHADRERGRREVWYDLTKAGRDLAPAIEELTLWGLRNARRPPEPGERRHPEHLLQALRLVLARTAPTQQVRWCFQFSDDGVYTLECDGREWTLTPDGATEADVMVTTSSDAWTQYLTTRPSQRPSDRPGINVVGKRSALRAFERAIAQFPDGIDD
jgi:DNA-binding HxlR family transcriptional regulator